MEGTFSEIEKVVHEEIPERNDSDSQQFREIEIEFQFVVEKVYGGVVDEQPYDRYADKPCVLHGDFGVVAFKCPDTVQQIVACRRTHETDISLKNQVIPKSTNTPEPPTKQNFMN